MSKQIVFSLLLLIVVGGGYYVYKRQSKAAPATTMTAPKQVLGASNAPAASAAPQKLMDGPDGKFAFKIFPGTISPESKKAMNGFSIKMSPQTDGSTQVMMTATNTEYKDQTYVVKPGNSLYFIERFAGDDNEAAETDKGLRDDTAVVVDAQGFIVQ